MTVRNANGVYLKSYSYNQCPTKACGYELPRGLPFSEWPDAVKVHVNSEHNGTSIWTKLVVK